jgi:ribosomal protein S18 acetylase RimI-like enzyme
VENITFREAVSEDTEVILSMMQRFYAIDQYDFKEAKARRELSEFLINPQLGKIWLIELQEVCIGYMALTHWFSFEFGGQCAFLDEFYIEEAFRHKGLGKRAIDHLVNSAQEAGIKTIHMEVEKHNAQGLSLYSGKGFVVRDRYLMSRKISLD